MRRCCRNTFLVTSSTLVDKLKSNYHGFDLSSSKVTEELNAGSSFVIDLDKLAIRHLTPLSYSEIRVCRYTQMRDSIRIIRGNGETRGRFGGLY